MQIIFSTIIGLQKGNGEGKIVTMLRRLFEGQPKFVQSQEPPSCYGERRRYPMGSRFVYVPLDRQREIEPTSENVGWLGSKVVVMDSAGAWRYQHEGETIIVTGLVSMKNGSLRRANFFERFFHSHFAQEV